MVCVEGRERREVGGGSEALAGNIAGILGEGALRGEDLSGEDLSGEDLRKKASGRGKSWRV